MLGSGLEANLRHTGRRDGNSKETNLGDARRLRNTDRLGTGVMKALEECQKETSSLTRLK